MFTNSLLYQIVVQNEPLIHFVAIWLTLLLSWITITALTSGCCDTLYAPPIICQGLQSLMCKNTIKCISTWNVPDVVILIPWRIWWWSGLKSLTPTVVAIGMNSKQARSSMSSEGNLGAKKTSALPLIIVKKAGDKRLSIDGLLTLFGSLKVFALPDFSLLWRIEGDGRICNICVCLFLVNLNVITLPDF